MKYRDIRIEHMAQAGYITEKDLAPILGLTGIWDTLRKVLVSKYGLQVIELPTTGSRVFRMYSQASIDKMLPRWCKDRDEEKARKKSNGITHASDIKGQPEQVDLLSTVPGAVKVPPASLEMTYLKEEIYRMNAKIDALQKDLSAFMKHYSFPSENRRSDENFTQ